MFGMPAAFVNGNMCASLFGERLLVRLPDAPRAELLAMEGGGAFEPMPGRPMKEYALVPPSVIADDAAVRGWLEQAISYAESMPTKAKKPRAATRRKA